MRRFGSVLILSIVGLLPSCASDEQPPPRHARVVDKEPKQVAVEREPTLYETEIGGLSQEEIEKELRRIEPKLIACVNQAATSMTFIGGRASVRMRLDREGGVRWVYLKESTLGDRDTERCVLDVVKSRTWPRPKSGEGLAETSFDVDAADPPSEVSDRTSNFLTRRASAVTRKCRKGVRGPFTATAYFGSRGQVLSAGVAPPDERGEPAADCIVDALKEMRLDRRALPNDAPSKVSFRLQ